MSLFASPEEHAANPPSTWRVVKVGNRSHWQIQDKTGASALQTCTTKKDAEALLTSGWIVDMYEKEGRWYAGETVPGWKPWEQCKADRDRVHERSLSKIMDGDHCTVWRERATGRLCNVVWEGPESPPTLPFTRVTDQRAEVRVAYLDADGHEPTDPRMVEYAWVEIPQLTRA